VIDHWRAPQDQLADIPASFDTESRPALD